MKVKASDQECKRIIERLNEVCREKGITYYMLANRVDISVSTVYSIMRQNTVPKISTLSELCEGLGISMSKLLADDRSIEGNLEERELLNCYRRLSFEKKKFLHILMNMLQQYEGQLNYAAFEKQESISDKQE